ncbi:major facilitator superfamily protein [Hirsutella rhossiliensis]|uniref:Major facilitator superfamily domain-containing protein n=1 Tax=Hirsutella rhossiliensis TaxID=111463 RepID=A0A9P8SLL2_9HYPO|nr:major facilitator superfamily domain-containing protein [Hirsutella rhossiliensis]KAH0965930.1 major facilitator superfamily domain-containing protein [Hirsutella rhossiliensis]
MPSISRFLPFSASTTTTQAVTYLLGVSLFSISFLVFLNSSVSFVITDLIGQKKDVGDVVGTLGFADELVALVACPAWGLISDRLGVRWVATIGYAIIGVALAVFVQAKNVYPQLLLARVFFAVGASAAATMVTAILPSLTQETGQPSSPSGPSRIKPNPRLSAAFSVESEATITPEIYTRNLSHERVHNPGPDTAAKPGKPSALAGLVGSFTGGVTPGEAVSYSFYVVGAVSLVVALFVFVGLRNLNGEEGKGWRVLLGIRNRYDALDDPEADDDEDGPRRREAVPYLRLMKDSVLLGFSDHRIALGYLGGFVARASTVAISLFIPLFVNTFFISNGFCRGSPNDPSPELKKECRAAYVLSSILSGVAQLIGLLCAPLFGYLSGRTRRVNYPVVVAGAFGMIGYIILPQLASPELKDVDGRGGSPTILVIVALIGISQIGAIVCSLGSLGQGVLAAELPRSVLRSIAGVYSLCGGAAILLLTKVGGILFDKLSHGAPFYMMAMFNGVWLVASLFMDASQAFARV